MLYLYVILVLAAAGLVYMRFEAGSMAVEAIKFTRNKKCFRIMQLSDIHISRLKVPVKNIVRAIEREKPDIIIMSGDYVEKGKHVPVFMDFLESIKGRCDIFLCLGNHDYKAFLGDEEGLCRFTAGLEKSGVKLLHNRSAVVEANGRKYNIIGISDIRYGCHDIDKAFEGCAEGASANIAFSHNPDIVLELPGGKVDYLFCGHFHGGQIWAPFNLEFRLLRNEKLCRMGIRRGLHKINGINLYISRGLGNVCFPLRFLSKPEVTMFYLP